jgi:hypothetical protein
MKLRSSVFGWKSVWMELAEERKGDFVDGTTLVKMTLPIKAKPWTLSMQMHSSPIGSSLNETTIIAAPFVARHPLTFAIRNTKTVEEIAKVFGMQDIIVGDSAFDKEYIIQGNNVEMVRELFSVAELRESIEGQKAINLCVADQHNKHFSFTPTERVHVLTFTEKGAINSFDRLTSLESLFTITLDLLHSLGVATLEDPDFVI